MSYFATQNSIDSAPLELSTPVIQSTSGYDGMLLPLVSLSLFGGLAVGLSGGGGSTSTPSSESSYVLAPLQIDHEIYSGNILDTNSSLEVVSFRLEGTKEEVTAGQSINITDVGSLVIYENGDYIFSPLENWDGECLAVLYTAVNENQEKSTSTFNLALNEGVLINECLAHMQSEVNVSALTQGDYTPIEHSLQATLLSNDDIPIYPLGVLY